MDALPEALDELLVLHATPHSLAMLALTSKNSTRRLREVIEAAWSHPEWRYRQVCAAMRQPGAAQCPSMNRDLYLQELSRMDGLPQSYLMPDGSLTPDALGNAWGHMYAILPLQSVRLLSVLQCDTTRLASLIRTARECGPLLLTNNPLLRYELEPILVRAGRHGADWTPERLLALCEAMYDPEPGAEDWIEELRTAEWDWDEHSLSYFNDVLHPLRFTRYGPRANTLAAVVSDEMKTATFRLHLASKDSADPLQWARLYAWFADDEDGSLSRLDAHRLASEVAAYHGTRMAVTLIRQIAAFEARHDEQVEQQLANAHQVAAHHLWEGFPDRTGFSATNAFLAAYVHWCWSDRVGLAEEDLQLLATCLAQLAAPVKAALSPLALRWLVVESEPLASSVAASEGRLASPGFQAVWRLCSSLVPMAMQAE